MILCSFFPCVLHYHLNTLPLSFPHPQSLLVCIKNRKKKKGRELITAAYNAVEEMF